MYKCVQVQELHVFIFIYHLIPQQIFNGDTWPWRIFERFLKTPFPYTWISGLALKTMLPFALMKEAQEPPFWQHFLSRTFKLPVLLECTAATVWPTTPNRTLARPRSLKPFHEWQTANTFRRLFTWKRWKNASLHTRWANGEFAAGFIKKKKNGKNSVR